MNSNMSEAHFNIPGEGVIVSNDPNTTADLIQSSGARKNNTVLNACVMFAFGVLGNMLALIVLRRSNCAQKRKLFYRMVAGLAMTDFFGIVATTPVVISAYVSEKWLGGDYLCKYFAFMMVFASTGTLMIVCLMAVERLICIRHPYLYYSRLSKRHATYFLLSSWLGAAVMASLPLLKFGKYILHYPYTWCFIDYYTNDTVPLAFNYVYALFAVVVITITVTCNCIVLYTLLVKKLKFSRKNNGNSRQFAGYSKRYAECQMVVLLIGITVVFTSCYLPLMIRIILNQTKLIPINLRMDLILIRLASMNQLLDPWVYILLRREVVWKVVQGLRHAFTCFCPKKEQMKTTMDTETGRIQCQIISTPVQLQTDYNPSCCVFCFHCMCDPPQSIRRESMMSFSEHGRRRSCRSPRETTLRFYNDSPNSFVGPTKGPVLKDEIRFKYLVRGSISSQSSQEVVSRQPTPDRENSPFIGAGETKASVTDPLLYKTLIENIHNSNLSTT